MAENNWLLQDGRSILVEFDAATPANTWELHDGKVATDQTFATPASAWANHDWLGGRGMIMAAEGGSSTNYILTCSLGAYVYIGQLATLGRGYSLLCDAGSYSYVGQSAILRRGYGLACTAGVYAYTGLASILRREYTLNCSVGAYVYSGQAATLNRSYTLACNIGTYAYSGQAAVLQRGYKLTCIAGAYSYIGNAATLTYMPGVTPYLFIDGKVFFNGIDYINTGTDVILLNGDLLFMLSKFNYTK